MNFKKPLLLIIAIVLTATMVACSNTANDTDKGEKKEMVTIEHQLGKTQVAKNPDTIVVFDYATLDSLNQMGVEVDGVVKSTMPEYLEKYNGENYKDIGTLFEPDFEKIYSMDPDLIIISGRQAEVYDDLEDIAPTIYLAIDNEDYLGSFSQNLNTLGEIFDKQDFVEEKLVEIEDVVSKVNDKASALDKEVLIVMANDGALSAYGVDSRFNVIHQEFGFDPADKNIEVSNHGHNISFEYIVETNPDIMFVIDRAEITGGSNTAAQILDNELVEMTSAYQSNDIYYLNAPVWYTAAGGLEGTNIMIKDVKAALN
ncbi:siderophore ABC transporter substrate-binding protein [Proteinivorax tanatarense]|uniref:Siderophore ABC transporter substrate-binding protein n=1 Tax=Proteinivorax tanatarense TaxID=1260629 RepID=A0AAU7VMH3_9FIRM